MLIRKNTKTFKTIVEILTVCLDRPDRDKLIRLYITKAGESIQERINIEGIEGQSALFYEMTYQTILNNIKSSNHQLHISDDVPGIYFLRSASNKAWDETPFEFDEAIKKEFDSLSELPVVRKKEKAQKFVIPKATVKPARPAIKKEKAVVRKAAKVHEPGPKQPDFKLTHKIQFTDLEKVVFRQAGLNKQDVLSYYNKIAACLLPHLKDRFLWGRLHSEIVKPPIPMTASVVLRDDLEAQPGWLDMVVSKSKEKKQLVLCNDREHLLWYVEMGCIEFDPSHARLKQPESPDYLIITMDSPDSELTKVIDVALAAKEILTGLQLPSFVKTDGISGLHLYIPLDAKSKFKASKSAAEYICRLIRIKIPNLVTLEGSEDYVFGKVSLNYSINGEDNNIIAPYSLVAGQAATVAAPLHWEEVKDGLRMEDFNHETIFKRLKHAGDPFETLFKKKISADALLQTLENHYAFLF